MLSSIRVLLICILSILSLTTAKDFNLDLEYSLDGASFSRLGSLDLQQKHDGNYTGNVKIDSSISSTLLKQIRSKVDSSPKSLYYIRSGNFLSSNLACYMLRSNLAHKLAVTIDQDAGVIESLTVFPDGLYDAESIEAGCSPLFEQSTLQLTSNVDVTVVHELPAPETAAYLHRMEEEKRNRQHGASTDNRSFLAKYWMYIVPAVLFLVVSSLTGGGEEGAAQ